MKNRQFWAGLSGLFVFVTYAWFEVSFWGPLDIYTLRLAGHLMAVWGLTFIFIQFVLVSRIKFLDKALTRKFLLKYHWIFGKIGISLIFLHAILILTFLFLAFGRINVHLFLVIGIIALAGFSAIAVKYMKWGMPYKAWRNIHRSNYVIFPFALIHVFYNALPWSLLYYLWMAFVLGYGAIISGKIYRFVQGKYFQERQ
jgi:hypothetical protein